MSRMRRPGRPIDSNHIEKRLTDALHSIQNAETVFRAKYVARWTIMFCDVSRKISQLTHLAENQLKELIEEYREYVLSLVEPFEPPYISPGGGPQLIICFDTPKEAAEAALVIQNSMRDWRYRNDGGEFFRPSIGLHTGEFVLKDEILKQSNACNLGKRVETEAEPGKIFISSSTYEELEPLQAFNLKFVKNALLKNIPEPQDIYSLSGTASTKQVQSTKEIDSPETGEELDEDVEDWMGILICDVSGSTKKFWMLGDREGNQLIDTFQKEVFFILKKYRATHIELREGDMIVACFIDEKPILNVMAAVEIQKNFFRRNTNLATRQRQKIETSIGIHYGKFLIRNKSVVPNLEFLTCKEIQDMAEANEVCLSNTVNQLIQEYTHFVMDDAGEIEIKGLEDPIQVSSLRWYKTTG